MPTVTVAELTALAESLTKANAAAAKTAAALDQHIAARAKTISDKVCVDYAKAMREQIDDHARTVGADLQRANDLVRELRRQMKPLIRYSDRYSQIAKAVNAARHAGADTVNVGYLLEIINAPAKPGTEET